MPDDESALDELRKGLTDARFSYDSKIQLGAAQSLQAVLLYLQASGFPPKLRAPLMGLLGALVDADNGVSNPHIAVADREKAGV